MMSKILIFSKICISGGGYYRVIIINTERTDGVCTRASSMRFYLSNFTAIMDLPLSVGW